MWRRVARPPFQWTPQRPRHVALGALQGEGWEARLLQARAYLRDRELRAAVTAIRLRLCQG